MASIIIGDGTSIEISENQATLLLKLSTLGEDTLASMLDLVVGLFDAAQATSVEEKRNAFEAMISHLALGFAVINSVNQIFDEEVEDEEVKDDNTLSG